MLNKKFQPEKYSFSGKLDSLDESLFSELSSDECSEIVGGFTVRNDSGITKRFYTFGASVNPQLQILQPNETGNYVGVGEYILYNSSSTTFQPTLSSPIGANDAVSFKLQGNSVVIGTAFLFSPNPNP
ncbi:hypothetical protein H6G76_14250 [Nostoc sp. FACHB-152]|uniref:hypothetical protein n=1 Tax=unclassified Nostoc TaxID=2593658 RepID=UPI0016883089|nr:MULTISPECIES: hypothetical protein [unclassified Nostoc]MBD2448305.1 hypothetical protein [Nostoc sp. FACHB-152]MBD2467467.1 hypothetical protein [Nostoc sp. FACHB-145]